MWVQPVCRHGYAVGEVGEGILMGTSANMKIVRFGGDVR